MTTVKELEKDGAKVALLIIALLLIAILGVIAWGHALTILWAWFIVPIFGVSTLTVPQAIGISLTIKLPFLMYFSRLYDNILKEYVKKRDLVDILADNIGKAIFAPYLVVLTGWVVTWFI